jgi:hypothetical protein
MVSTVTNHNRLMAGSWPCALPNIGQEAQVLPDWQDYLMTELAPRPKSAFRPGAHRGFLLQTKELEVAEKSVKTSAECGKAA